MIKIDRVGAYQYMRQADFNLMDKIHAELAKKGASENKELSSQFFVGADKGLYLEFYLDGEQVERVHFLTRKIKLTADGERRLAEAIERENVEMENKTVEVVAGLDKGMLRDKVFELDQVVGSIEINAATIENVDIELGKISLDIEETSPDLQSMALMFNEIRNQVQLISDLMNYIAKDLKANTEHLGALQGALWQEVKHYEDD